LPKEKRTESPPPLILLGFMGSGKTTLARLLGERLRIPAYDLDEEIERETSRTIPEIFAEEGEEGFRTIETRVLRRFLEISPPFVLAWGGGTATKEENWEIARSLGAITFWIAPPLEVMYERVRGSNRPLLRGEEKERWERFRNLYESRKPWYHRARYRIEGAGEPSTLLPLILEKLGVGM
jgi:shikimate kinase